MKRKIFGILFALVLVLGVSLVPAVPVMAQTAAFDPISGPVGTTITVTGAGWSPSETIDAATGVTVGGAAATHTLIVDGAGNLSGDITVPTLTGGLKDIVITGSVTTAQTFSNAFTVTAAANFIPNTGPVGTTIAVTGTGWAASETINPVTVGGAGATHTLTVDGTGNLSGDITVPTLTGGLKDIVITGSVTTAQTFSNAFTVTAAANFIPNTGPVGTTIAVTGTGWAASETINPVTVGGAGATHTLTVDGSGNLSGDINVPTLTGGLKDIVITGSVTTAQTFSNAFTVTAAANFNPTSGLVGTTIAVTGTGWAASETINPVTVGGAGATHTLTVDGSGNLSGNITVPTLTVGLKDIVITGSVTTAQTFSNAFTVTVVLTGGGVPPPDTTPPSISGISASNITGTGADIGWKTNEWSTSQVEYWSSPGTLSPLDETMCLDHLVHLTGLTPGTTYHYKTMSTDSAGNLEVSDEDTFATLGEAEAAAFSASDLSISPSEVNIGETVTISALVANTGNATGDYEVTLKINDMAEATKEVTVDAGASKEVTFTTAKDVAGSYSVDVNGLSGSFTVKEKPVPAPPPPPPAPPPEVKAVINWPVVGGIIAAVVVVGLLIFFLVVRRRA